MMIEDQIHQIQSKLIENHLDGWLLYDCHGSNRFARELLAITPEKVLTRRFFYWIPQRGDPVKIVHEIESDALDHLPGVKYTYLSWPELEASLKRVLGTSATIAMEYSPRNANPYVSVIDAGTMELVRDTVPKVTSSADLLQHFTSVLDEHQLELHKEAAAVLAKALDKAWELIAHKIRAEASITEYEVQQFILSEFAANNCITADGPACSINENTARPHYLASRKTAKPIGRGDFILIDLWCKKDVARGVYADITRVAVAAPEPTPKQQQIFDVVKEAQEAGIAFLRKRLAQGKPTLGKEIDDACRHVIEKAGYGPYFNHRTGHNIDIEVHGSGAHLDNLETSDSRKILTNTCFSIEPGIYLPDEFGVRLEDNILVHEEGSLEITSPKEENILCLL